MQIDSVIAGYAFFINDPHFNFAKALIAIFGTVNTLIILSQIYIIYGTPETEEEPGHRLYMTDDEIRFSKPLTKLLTPLLPRELSSIEGPTCCGGSSCDH